MPCVMIDCPSCKNFLGTRDAPQICKAFPKGIPDDLYFGKIDVKQLKECQHGYNFIDKHEK